MTVKKSLEELADYLRGLDPTDEGEPLPSEVEDVERLARAFLASVDAAKG